MTKDMTLFEYLQKRADDKMLTYYEFAKEMKMSPNTLSVSYTHLRAHET